MARAKAMKPTWVVNQAAFVDVDFKKGNVLKRYEFHFADFTYFESYSYILQG